MKQIMTVCAYTFKEGVRKKAFIISTVIIMAIILLLCLAPNMVSMFRGDDKKAEETGEKTAEKTAEKDGSCYLIDETGIFEKNLQNFKALFPEREFQTAQKQDMKKIKKKVGEYEKNSLLYIEDKQGIPVIHVMNSNIMKGIDSKKISEVCNSIWQTEILTAQGVSPEVIAASQMQLPCLEEAVGEMNLTGYVLGLVMTFVMFFAVYYYGYGVAMSVASEKTSRVMETLIISAKPSRILVGKCLAMGVLGLLQLCGLLLFGLLCYQFLIPEGMQIGGVDLSFSGFSAGTISLLAVYFILGYALYAVLNSVCGAAVSKVEDLNSAMMPVSVIAVLGFYLGYFTSVAGGGSSLISKAAVYLPISSPFAVPFKLLTGDIKTGELIISIILLAAAVVLTVALSARIYSASVMHYGNKLKWKDLKKIRTE